MPVTEPISDDPLEALRAEVHATRRAAEDVARQAAAAAERERRERGGAPPRGWAATSSGDRDAGDLAAVAALADAVRGVLPRDLERAVLELLRQLLIAARALLEWWIWRLDQRSQEPEIEIEDIPVS